MFFFISWQRKEIVIRALCYFTVIYFIFNWMTNDRRTLEYRLASFFLNEWLSKEEKVILLLCQMFSSLIKVNKLLNMHSVNIITWRMCEILLGKKKMSYSSWHDYHLILNPVEKSLNLQTRTISIFFFSIHWIIWENPLFSPTNLQRISTSICSCVQIDIP